MQARSSSNILGIDVSHHQKTIDWHLIKASGVEFVYIKATEGTTYTDPMMSQHYKGAKSAGLMVGFYHYARPYNNPRAEVTNLLQATRDYPHDLPYALDIETTEDGKYNKGNITAFCFLWLTALESMAKESPIIYTYTHFAKAYLDKSLARWPVWIAHYGTDEPGENGIWNKWAIFQYTSSGSLPGYNGRLDMNVMEAEFMAVFKDVPEKHWAAKAIEKVAEAGLMSGFPEGTFKPNEPVTRAELASVLARLIDGGKI